jgi:hypothetical protein
MFNGLATNEWIRRQCDEDHDARCECGLKETQEHIKCECTTKGVLKARKAMAMEVDLAIFGTEGEKKEVPASMVKASRILRIKVGTKKLVDYDSHEDQSDWMGLQKGEAARRWLDDGTYPMWTGFITKGWREMHAKMKIQQIVTTTRKIRGNMEEGRWKMWTARCDRVHKKEDDVTISERGNTYMQK